jgi:hypothetical protein
MTSVGPYRPTTPGTGPALGSPPLTRTTHDFAVPQHCTANRPPHPEPS